MSAGEIIFWVVVIGTTHAYAYSEAQLAKAADAADFQIRNELYAKLEPDIDLNYTGGVSSPEKIATIGKGGKNSTGYKYWKESVDFQGNKVYQRNDLFDPNQVSSWKDHGKTVTGTNVERMASGRAPIGYDGKSVNLHHLLQTPDGPIAEVSKTFHNKYYSTIHMNTGQSPSLIDRYVFGEWRSNYWMNRVLDFD